MKKVFYGTLITVFMLAFAACGNQATPENTTAADSTALNTTATITVSVAETTTAPTAPATTAAITTATAETSIATNETSSSASEPASEPVSEPANETVTEKETSAPENETTVTPDETAGTLVVYFSRVGNTDFPADADASSSASLVLHDGVLKGNAQLMAEWIADEAEAELFEICTVEPYAVDYTDTINAAKKEQNEDARPELSTHIENIDSYDTVYIVFPNWWGDLPQALYSFFDEYDFADKQLDIFNTHGGSGFSRTIATIRELEPQAEVKEGLSVRDRNVPNAEKDIREWVKNNK